MLLVGTREISCTVSLTDRGEELEDNHSLPTAKQTARFALLRTLPDLPSAALGDKSHSWMHWSQCQATFRTSLIANSQKPTATACLKKRHLPRRGHANASSSRSIKDFSLVVGRCAGLCRQAEQIAATTRVTCLIGMSPRSPIWKLNCGRLAHCAGKRLVISGLSRVLASQERAMSTPHFKTPSLEQVDLAEPVAASQANTRTIRSASINIGPFTIVMRWSTIAFPPSASPSATCASISIIKHSYQR